MNRSRTDEDRRETEATTDAESRSRLSRRTVLQTAGALAGAGALGVGQTDGVTAASETTGEFRNWRAREASEVWDRGYRGRPDRTVAVGDTGVDARHPDLGPWNEIRIVNDGDGLGLAKLDANDDEERMVAELGPYGGTIGPGAKDADAAEYERHAFTAPDDAEQVDATLGWTANTQDLDFFLEDAEGNTIGSSTNFGGPERIKAPVTPGAEYALVVETYASVAADYEIVGAFVAGGVTQTTFDGSPIPTGEVTAETPKLVGWLGGTFPRDGNGHGSHVSSITGGTGRGSAIDESTVVTEEPRTVLALGETLEYEIDAAADTGVYVAAYGTAIELVIEDPEGRTIDTAEAGDDTSESGDVTVAEAYAPEAGTYTASVRAAGGETVSTARVERASAGAFLHPDETAGDRTGDAPTLHAGVAPNASLVGFQGLSTGLTALSEHGEWVTETFNVRSVNFSFGGLPTERTGITDIYEQVRSITENGVLVVSSAGNNGPLTGSTGPSGADEAVAAVATGPMDGITAYSSGGTVVRDEDGGVHRKPDVTAPGGTLTDPVDAVEAGDPESDDPVRDYTGKAGTSMASPYANGVAGLVSEAMEFDAPAGIALPEPSETGYDDVLRLKQALLATASETAFTAAPYHRAHTPTYDFGGRDPYEGFGRVNPDAAVDAVTRELSGTTAETVGLNRPADSRAVAGYVTAGSGTLSVDAAFSHYSGGNAGQTKGDPHVDLFVYDARDPAQNGEPNVVAGGQGLDGDASASASFGREAEESVYYVVAKLVNVPGAVNGDDVRAHVDLSVAFEPGTFVEGTREDDASVFTAGQTNRIDLAVDPSAAGPVRDAVPTEWTVETEFSDDVERVEQRDGVQYVHFGEEAAADVRTEYTYLVEAPEEGSAVSDTGRYGFGPIEVRIDGEWIAAAGTSETDTVVGLDTDV